MYYCNYTHRKNGNVWNNFMCSEPVEWDKKYAKTQALYILGGMGE